MDNLYFRSSFGSYDRSDGLGTLIQLLPWEGMRTGQCWFYLHPAFIRMYFFVVKHMIIPNHLKAYPLPDSPLTREAGEGTHLQKTLNNLAFIYCFFLETILTD